MKREENLKKMNREGNMKRKMNQRTFRKLRNKLIYENVFKGEIMIKRLKELQP